MLDDIKLGYGNRCPKWASEVHSLNGNQCASSFIRRMFANGFCSCRVGCRPGTNCLLQLEKMQAKCNYKLKFLLVVSLFQNIFVLRCLLRLSVFSLCILLYICHCPTGMSEGELAQTSARL